MNVKLGDLAIVIDGDAAGHIVKVLRREAWQDTPDTPSWRVEFSNPVMMHWKRGNIEFDAPALDGVIEDSRLRPVSGLHVPEHEDTEAIA